MSIEERVARLRQARLVACIGPDHPDPLARATEAIQAGFGAIELSRRIPNWADLLEALPEEGLLVGVGDILDAETARLVAESGADFLGSPVAEPSVAEWAHSEDAPCLLGALTPTEVLTAVECGADIVRLGPIDLVGGAAYLREIRVPLGHLPLAAWGRLSRGDAEECLAAGAWAVLVELSESVLQSRPEDTSGGSR
ncbi:MAG: bifunctional 4-hydroxy-2-oxoglutarate aldolase/2-dehydro-3-deoxy-phosphogluconate aldolase [Candidatus Dormibacteria bacterium]